MPLPIAIGGKCESAQELPGPCCHPDDLEDGTPLQPVELYQTLAWGTCPKNEWLIRVTASYYDLVVPATGRREITMVEVRVQVSFLTRPLSPNYRETSHHLKLFDGAKDECPQSQPQVVVSEDRRNLAVLLFHPHQQSSAVVIFQLRIPRSDLVISSPIPLPTYCANTGNDNNASSVFSREAPMIASHPRFVSVWGISTICCIPNTSPPILLAVCHDGGFVWLDVRSSLAVASGMLSGIQPEHLPFSSIVAAPTSTMEKGTLIATSSRTGHAVLATWKIEKKTRAEHKTFLKRASTGAVVVPSEKEAAAKMVPHRSKSSTLSSSTRLSPTPRQPVTAHNNRTTSRRTPVRSFSAGAERALNNIFSPQRTKQLSTMLGSLSQTNSPSSSSVPLGIGKPPLTKNFSSGIADLSSALAGREGNRKDQQQKEEKNAPENDKKQQMDTLVIKELQKKAEPVNSINNKSKTPPPAASSGSPRKPLRRIRKSDAGTGAGRASQNNKGSPMMRSMQLKIITTLDDENLVYARFDHDKSTILCAVYNATKTNPKVARIFNLCGEIGTLQPIVTLSLSSDQVDNATDMACSSKYKSTSSNGKGAGDKNPIKKISSLCSRLGSDYDPSSGCFAINTTYDARWVGFLWNWRANALGWIVQNSMPTDHLLWCRLYFGKHEQQGSHFAYLESTQEKYLKTRKAVIATGLLSPPNSNHATTLEPCSLLLSGDSVSFPDISQRDTGVAELEWKVSKLPFMYLNAYGPPKVAAVGRLNGSTLAVASSCGVCILDHKHRWKQFGSPGEEKTFSIVAMTWWEGTKSSVGSNTTIDEETENLLVAVIQSNNGRQYLSCWSPHRLDLAHQLLETKEHHTTSEQSGGEQEPSWGIPLTKSVRATNISLLEEPVDGQAKSGGDSKRRAVVFVSSSNIEACSVDFAIFQLQLTRGKLRGFSRAESYVEQKPYSVLVHPSCNGTIRKGSPSVGPVSSLFLAGASFRFDLSNPTAMADGDFVGLVGIIRAPGGIEAIVLTSSGESKFSSLIDADEVSRIALIDIVHSPSHTFKNQGRASNCFVWLVELLSGAIFTWSAPFLMAGESGDDFQSASFLRASKSALPKGLRPPTLVCKKESRNDFLLGTLCHVGNASDWMQQSSPGCQADISLGNVPRSVFGCILRSGQSSRKLHRRHVADGLDADIFPSDFLKPEVHGPSSFMMTPPAFVPSLYSLFLEAAYLRTEVSAMKESKPNPESVHLDAASRRLQAIEYHVENRLKASPNEDAVIMALRLLLIRSVEMLTDVNKKHLKEVSDVTQSSLLLASTLFSEIVDAVRRCTTNLQFASLFLEAGRQIEPSCLAHLFPLPAPGKSLEAFEADTHGAVEGRLSARSVVELFSLCVEEGSYAASVSALPLMGSRIQARNYCDLLLARSIGAFIDNTHSVFSKFDVTEEERRVIGDIFRYGMKLEDSGRLEESILLGEESSRREKSIFRDKATSKEQIHRLNGSFDDSSDFTALEASPSTVSVESQSDTGGHSLICIGGRQSAILSYLVPSMFDDPKNEEEEIRNAANSFIDAELEPTNLDFLVQADDDGETDDGNKRKSVGEFDVQTVGGLVGEVIVNTLLTPKTDRSWKAMASLAALLLPNEDANGVEVYTRAGEMVQLEELAFLVQEEEHNGEGMERVMKFVSIEMRRCESSLNEVQARKMVRLVLKLLSRIEEFPLPKANHSFVMSGLLLIGLIAGHVAGRTPILLADLDDNHVLVKCYGQAVASASLAVA